MSNLLDLLPSLIAMGILISCSAVFSASEVALFYLRPADRRAMKRGTTADRMAERLLHDPQRLLSAVLFWNLLCNLAYFTLASVIALRLERSNPQSNTWAIAFAISSLLCLIFFGELLPKSVGVLLSRRLARAVALPLSIAVRLLDPIMPLLRGVQNISLRALWPNLRPEAYLEINDLERAIQLSVSDAELLKQEQTMLANIVQLSDIRVDEWMRPRTQFQAFRPPVHRADLLGKDFRTGYLLVTELQQDEISRAICLTDLYELPERNIDRLAVPVLYLPWCSTVAVALEKMTRMDRQVVVIVSERGESIGLLTIEDILEMIFNYAPSRSKRILDENPIHYISPNRWVVSGMVGLRQLARRLQLKLPESRSLTISGVIQEMLQRLAQPGDQCTWGPFELRVLEYPFRGHMLVELILRNAEESTT
jgi:CBS domain containing-hemolysin-like protein